MIDRGAKPGAVQQGSAGSNDSGSRRRTPTGSSLRIEFEDDPRSGRRPSPPRTPDEFIKHDDGESTFDGQRYCWAYSRLLAHQGGAHPSRVSRILPSDETAGEQRVGLGDQGPTLWLSARFHAFHHGRRMGGQMGRILLA